MTEKLFKQDVWAHYKKYGRHTLPWRMTQNPYRILVSEIMLQQTQVDRVLPKYKAFIKRFPSIKILAKAERQEVFKEWQGLGYNRRAKFLHDSAKEIVNLYGGVIPKDRFHLEKLSGIGPYTASAVLVFAYNQPEVLIETNIRTVYLHHFFKNKKNVSDKKLLPHIEKTLDKKNPREWYFALMDYGNYLKSTIGNVSRRSAHYQRQSAFKGSIREARGAILRALSKQKSITKVKLFEKYPSLSQQQLENAIIGLANENIISAGKGNNVTITLQN